MLDRLPPVFVRRIIVAPAVLVLSLLGVIFSPFAFAAAAIIDLAIPRGKWPTLRLVAFVVGYLMLEIVGLVSLFVLWIRSGFGWKLKTPKVQEAHYSFMRWWLRVMDKMVRRLFHLKVLIEDRPEPTPGPILVFCRHAGPGNSLLLIGTLLVGYRRHPRIVMLAKLQWEPMFDVMLNRVPNRFIKHDPARRDSYIDAIGDLAANLGDDEAFVLFPEGKDFTPRVRTRAIDYLKRKGHLEAAERAERMKYVLPPRHNGVRAALQAAPEADCVFVAHSVLEEVGTFKELWARIPFDKPVIARYWRIPASEMPTDEDALIESMYVWWERIDAWCAEKAAAHATTP